MDPTVERVADETDALKRMFSPASRGTPAASFPL